MTVPGRFEYLLVIVYFPKNLICWNNSLGLGINTLEVDGHNLSDLISTFEKSKKIGGLNCILAKTVKGKGSSIMENKKDWHYWNAMSDEEIEKTRKELA